MSLTSMKRDSNFDFSCISLSNTSKQLNTEISAMRKDLMDAFDCLTNKGLMPQIQTIFNDEIHSQIADRSDNYMSINLSRLFSIMLKFQCTIQLIHISKLKLFNTKSKSKSAVDFCQHIDINIWEIFHKQNENNKHKISQNILNDIHKIRNQTKDNPILLFYGDQSANECEYELCFKKVAVMNNIIWTESKTAISHSNHTKVVSAAATAAATAAAQSHAKSHRARSMKIPKRILPPYHDKNYHLFGRRHNLPNIAMSEICKHCNKDSCWIIVNALVLDVTAFLPYHPAADKCIINNAAKICDRHFKYHSKNAQKLFFKFAIGTVEQENHCIIQ